MFTIAVIGGDERARRLAGLCEEGFSVITMGLAEGDEQRARIEDADVLLFPYPFSVLHTGIPNLQKLNIDPFTVLGRAKDGAHVIAGAGLEPYLEIAGNTGKRLEGKRYQDAPGFLQANADISAEGALCYAMQQLDVSVAGLTVLVTGYGLFGRALARKLRALDADVIVAARSEAARQKAAEEGMRAAELTEWSQAAQEARVIMNTVPARIMDREALLSLPCGMLLLELAGAPYGFDLDEAQALGLAAARLPGIPGRYAPQSAAKALLDAACRLLSGGNRPWK